MPATDSHGAQPGFMGPDFPAQLTRRLSLALGPVASILIEDATRELGLSLDRLPCGRAPELVEALAAEILREDKKIEFQKAMLELLQAAR